MKRFEPVLKAVVLAGLALMFYAKISDGTLTFYINARFAWLSFVAVLIFAALAMTLVYQITERRRAEQMNEREHERIPLLVNGRKLSWAGVAIMAIPMLLGLIVPARPLGASAVSSRGIGLNAPDRPGTAKGSQNAQSGPKNVLDWLRDFGSNADPASFKGQAVDVTGFVYRDPRNGTEQFWVSRFTISCCVADATAIGMLVQTAQAASLKNDSWVHVTGKLDVGEFAGEKVPMILPDKISPTDQPQNPYLYP
ncbi:MAG TPA: TIGR03943 family protein [Anaerolineae bacterium]